MTCGFVMVGIALAAVGCDATRGPQHAPMNARDTSYLLLDEPEEQHSVLEAHTDTVMAIASTEDGSMFATGSVDGVVVVWARDTSKPTHTFKGHPASIWKLSFDSSGKRLVSHDIHGKTVAWDLETRRALLALETSPHFIEWARSGEVLVTLDIHRTELSVWNAAARTRRCLIPIQANPPAPVALSPSRTELAVAGPGRSVNIWDIGSCDRLRVHQTLRDLPLTLAYSPDGKQLAVGQVTRALARMLESGEPWTKVLPAIALVLGESRSLTQIIDVDTGAVQFAREMEHGIIDAIEEEAFDLVGAPLFILYASLASIFSVAFSPSGDKLLMQCPHSLNVWDIEEQHKELALPMMYRNNVRWTRDGEHIYVQQFGLTVWQIRDGHMRELEGGHARCLP